MRRLLTVALLGAGLASVAAYAQYAPRYESRDFQRGDLFDRVRADLDRVEGASYWNGGDRHRLNKVREELGEFQRGGNRHELNDAIGALQKVVNDNRMPPRDREMLASDLFQMRDYRARMGWR
ncbi:MAG TPA: hypothetical protein VMH80_21595 [Bryobacteraceae bacterium]|nr:hypothetical protein [Bryobacteraceae bacterium]